MKKSNLFLFLFLGLSVSAYSQSKIGLKAGLNLANELVRSGNQSSTTKVATLFHLGAYYDAAIKPGFSIQPGISLQGKGGKSEVEGQTLTDRLLYIEVPVNFLGRVPNRLGDFYYGGGPYVAYGVDARVTSGRDALHLEWGSESDQLNPFDAGLTASLGFRFLQGFTINLSSSIGFVNMSNMSDVTYRNSVTSIGVGYEFGLGK